MARYRVLHGSVKTAGGFVAAGGFVELSESDAASIGDLEAVSEPSLEIPKPQAAAVAAEPKPKVKTK